METYLGRNEHHINNMTLSEFKDFTRKTRPNLTGLKTLLSITKCDLKKQYIFYLRKNYKDY